jgi:pyroglutamyl-peptidase
MTLLITGFEPFGGWSENPTAAIAPAVGEALGQPWAILPVDLDEAPRRLRELRERHRPKLTLHLGLSGRATGLELERAALNVADFRIPDAVGRQPFGTPLIEGAPDGLMTRLDLYGVRDAVDGAVISNSAGTYLCNALYYFALHLSGGRSLFIHVPPTPGMVADADRTEHGRIAPGSLPLEAQIQAVEAAALYLLATP